MERIHTLKVEDTNGWQKLLAKMGIPVKLGYGRREGWKGELPFYLFECPHCKTLVIDHPHGYQQYLLCPKCDHEKKLR